MDECKILEFAKSLDYTGIRKKGNWKNYEVYEFTDFDSIPDGAIIGLPLVLLVTETEIRLSTSEERLQILDDL